MPDINRLIDPIRLPSKILNKKQINLILLDKKWNSAWFPWYRLQIIKHLTYYTIQAAFISFNTRLNQKIRFINI